MLQRRGADSGDVLGNFWLITLLNTVFKTLTKVLVKKLVLVGSLVGEAQTSAILSRSIHDRFHFVLYIIERDKTKFGSTGLPYQF